MSTFTESSIIVWRLDRLGRSLPHLLETVAGLDARGAGFRSICDAIDTTSAGGRLVFHLMGSLAEFERSLIGERTKAGMSAAKSRGAMIGRRRALTSDQLEHAKLLVSAGQPASLVARTLGVGRSTLYRALSPV
ncbi:MAG: recombinase family protein [Ginsengibacter sp.]